MRKLFKLKSNRTTIVRKDGMFGRVVWSAAMQYGYDSRWMMHRWNPDNVIPLTKTETKTIEKKLKKDVA